MACGRTLPRLAHTKYRTRHDAQRVDHKTIERDNRSRITGEATSNSNGVYSTPPTVTSAKHYDTIIAARQGYFTAELYAVYFVLTDVIPILNHHKILIVTDSEYMFKGALGGVLKWRRHGWRGACGVVT